MERKNFNEIIVSIVIPVYNEEKYIEKCIISLLNQDFPREKMEWIFVDGGSTDKTTSIIREYINKYPNLISFLLNQNKTVPYGMNIGIKESIGKYIIRLDAHSEYETDYISKCVYYLDNTDADNVGGVAQTKGIGFIGNAIARMLSCKFGVGNSHFRTNGKDGYVDTVPFGAFRREVFSKYGLYDERLTRNQDNEMNYRIRKNGGKIYMTTDIKLTYYCRNTLKGIISMAIKNGKWNIITMRLCPGSMGLRHFIPLIFLLSLIIIPILSIFILPLKYLLLFEIALYLFLDLIFSFKITKNISQFLFLIILFPIFHLSYGIGSLIGIFHITINYKNYREECKKNHEFI